jgi:integrase
MASIRQRKRGDGTTAHNVLWKLGGNGRQQSETFDTDPEARQFAALVDAHGQQWPPGWVKGHGFAEPEPDDAPVLFADWATKYLSELTGIESRTRGDYRRDIDRHMIPFFGHLDVRDPTRFGVPQVRQWINYLETEGKQIRGADGKPARTGLAPKTIHNLHGLLFAIMDAAVKAEPPLRAKNPCADTRLPREDDEDSEATFLTPQEVALLRSCFKLAEDQLLIDVLYGTGLRYSEATALQPHDIELLTKPARLRVRRAWKRQDDGTYKLGRPKSRASRRTVTFSPRLVDALVPVVALAGSKDLIFTGSGGGRLHYSTFGDRWTRAVKAAKELGLDKDPTPHDLRHSHVSALIAAGIPLSAIRRRVGHDSITTTDHTYGHLLPELDDRVLDSVEASLRAEPARVPQG